MNKTLNDICSEFDKHEIVDSRLDIDREYYAYSEAIYSDGEVESNVTRDGYIHITSVKNASYIIFADRECKTCLCIYKNIPHITFKYIMEYLYLLQRTISNIKKLDYINENIVAPTASKRIELNNVIDINTFTCDICGSTDKLIYTRSNTNPDVLKTKCDKCKTEYTFVPSKYYKLASKRIVYFKSEESSRQIEITDPKKE